MRDLLIETFPITGPGFNWEVRHWEGNRFHRDLVAWDPDRFAEHILWETGAGRLVGMLHHEGDEIVMQIHPDFRAQIEETMLECGESYYAEFNQAGRRQAHMLVYECAALADPTEARLPENDLWLDHPLDAPGRPAAARTNDRRWLHAARHPSPFGRPGLLV